MSGKTESLTESRLQDFEKDLDKFISQFGLNKYHHESCVDEALNLSLDQIRKIHPDECSDLCYKLSQYGVYIQGQYNRFKNKAIWANEMLNITVAKEGKKYGTQYTKYEEKKYMVIADNSFARTLHDIYLKCVSCENELYGIADRIYKLSRALSEVRDTKRHKM